MIQSYGGQSIYIHGISPVGASNSAISGSGTYSIPAISRNASVSAISVPSSMQVGKSYAVTVTMKNTGNVSWTTSGVYRLGAQGDTTTWGLTRVAVPSTVAPGGTATFSFNVTPQTTGSINFAWQMLQENVAWFGSATSQTVDVNAPPVITLDSPSNGSTQFAPANLVLSATASDPNDSVAKVVFYSNGAIVGTDTNSPYQLTLSSQPVGTYAIYAVAYDSKGLSTTSSTSTVTVDEAHAPTSVNRVYVYDDYHLLCKVIEPETGSTVMGYDNAGNVIWSAAGLDLPSTTSCDRDTAYASSRRVDRTYDARNRLSTLSFPDSNGNQSWTYTADGLPATVTTLNDAGASSVVNAYVYNKRRMLTGESMQQTGQDVVSLGYGYDANGSPSTVTYPSGLTVSYTPNALGQPTKITDGAGNIYASGMQYYPNGAVSQFTYGNGVVHTLALNARQMPYQVRDSAVVAYEYAYDADGNVTAIYDQQQGDSYSRTMQYDGLNRLTQATSASFGGDDGIYHYSYDALDNLITAKLAGSRDYNYWYDDTNRLTNIRDDDGASTIGLAYDVQGNLANKNGTLYDFDYGNRLRQVEGIESYRYDAQGRRVMTSRVAGGTNTSLYSQSGQLMYEVRADTGTLEYIQYNGSLLATRTNSAITYQHTDALGSPVATTDTAGQLSERTQYEPYGAAIGKTVDGVGYTGHVMDGSTGLTYMQQRYYASTIGRFLSVDPVTAYSDPMRFFNRYKYASNNPFSFKDPGGRADYYNFPNGVVVVIQHYDNQSQFSNAQIEGQASKFNGATSSGKNMVVQFRPGTGSDAVKISTNKALSDAPGSNNRSHADQINGRNVELAPDAVGTITVGHEMGHTLGAGDQYKGGIDANGKQLSSDVAGSQGAIMRDYGGKPATQQTRDEIERNATKPGNRVLNCSSMKRSSCK